LCIGPCQSPVPFAAVALANTDSSLDDLPLTLCKQQQLQSSNPNFASKATLLLPKPQEEV
jgi:hypothetical protein